MDKSRLKFDKEILEDIFSTIKEEVNLTQLSMQLKVPYRTLKGWKYGESKIPEVEFKKIKFLYPKISEFERFAEKLPHYWGQRVGGIKSINKLNKEEITKRMQHIRSLKSRHIIPEIIKLDLNDNNFLEFYGILMGDGCLSQYLNEGRIRRVINITGNSIKDVEYMSNYVIPLIKKIFNINTKIKFRKDCNAIDILFSHMGVFEALKSNGFPVGKKGQISIPENISSLEDQKINNLIRGFFDTDGCITAKKHEGYKYPYVIITTMSVILRKQFKEILRKQGFPAYIVRDYVAFRGNKHFKKWFELIGSNNPRNLNRYYEWLKTGKLESVGS